VLLIYCNYLANVIIVRVAVFALKQCLADKVESVRAAAEATVGSVKAYLLRKRRNCGVVIRGVVEYKVTYCIRADAKLLQCTVNNLSHILTRVSAH
jgi:hypothetical protein